jgi:hypothetical protein
MTAKETPMPIEARPSKTDAKSRENEISALSKWMAGLRLDDTELTIIDHLSAHNRLDQFASAPLSSEAF